MTLEVGACVAVRVDGSQAASSSVIAIEMSARIEIHLPAISLGLLCDQNEDALGIEPVLAQALKLGGAAGNP